MKIQIAFNSISLPEGGEKPNQSAIYRNRWVADTGHKNISLINFRLL